MPFVFSFNEDREVILLSMDGAEASGVSGVQQRPRMCIWWMSGKKCFAFMHCFDFFAILSLWSEVEADRGIYTNACFYTGELKL